MINLSFLVSLFQQLPLLQTKRCNIMLCSTTRCMAGFSPFSRKVIEFALPKTVDVITCIECGQYSHIVDKFSALWK